MHKDRNPLSRHDNLVVQELDGEVLIYDLDKNQAYCLNETSAAVWSACDGNRDLKGIRDFARVRLGSDVDDDLLWLALDQLAKASLIQNAPDVKARFAGVSRRDVIKRIGAASLVALPVLVSLSAPMAVHANSLCMTLVGGCQCGLGDNQPAGMFCTPSGAFSMACADTNCRCLSQGLGADNCVP
ncbi:MAG: PqqD family protein [Acidobacteria bacterium]|nr:PqqD family protein [Acidobacteriota bacterium]MBK8146735.1 PqqD family protein [Acidobacteriota bacterium]MBK8812979.1 PqqD family protein [Acidobacteriota bacterium]